MTPLQKEIEALDDFSIGKAWEAKQQEWVILHEPKEIKSFLRQSLLRFTRSVVEEAIDNELNRWNSGGEYYDNVTKALTQLKSNVEKILKDNEKEV